MFGFSLGIGLANRFVAWWGDWRLALDFTAGRYHPKGEAGLVLTETRASSALVLQGNGTYVERYGPRTNEINSAMEGAVVGVIGSGGVLPDNFEDGGLTNEILNIDGASLDINFQSSGNFPGLFLGALSPTDSGVPTIAGDEWVLKVYVTRLPGIWELAGGGLDMLLQTRTASDVFIANVATHNLSGIVEGVRTLVVLPVTISGGTVAKISPVVGVGSTGGSPRDFSLRIEEVQLERGLKDTSFISGPAGTSVPAELAIGQGVGLQVSEEAINLFQNPDNTGVTLGAIEATESLPTGWTRQIAGSGLSHEIVSIGTMSGLPSFGIRIFGTASGGAQYFIRSTAGASFSIPASLNDLFTHSIIARLADGDLTNISAIEFNEAMWSAGGVFLGYPIVNYINELSISEISGEPKRYASWSKVSHADAYAFDPTFRMQFAAGPVDVTFEIAASNCTVGKDLKPIVMGTGIAVTRDADNPVVVQGVGGVPWDGYDLATGVTFQQVFSPSDTDGVEAFTFSDGTSDNYLIVRCGAGGGVEIEAYLAGVLTFSAESSTPFPTALATIELYMEQGATVTVALDGVILSDLTQAGKTLADYSQVSLACGAGTSTITEIYGK